MDKTNIVKLALDTMHGTVSGDFSSKDASSVLREALIEANGGSTKLNIKTFHRGNAVFEIVETLLPYMIEEGLRGDEGIFNLVEYVNMAEGDQNEFWAEDNSELVVARIANGSTSIRRQRLNVGQHIAIDTQMHAIKVYEELQRLLAGRIDFNTLVDRVSKSFVANMRNDILAVLEGVTATTAGLSSTYVQSGSFAAADLNALIAHVEAATGKKAFILGTKAGLAKITEGASNAVALASSTAKEDVYNLGYFGKFYGTPMVSMRQAHQPGTETFALNDNRVYVIAGDDRPIKCVNEGDGLLIPNDALNNADLTQELDYVAFAA